MINRLCPLAERPLRQLRNSPRNHGYRKSPERRGMATRWLDAWGLTRSATAAPGVKFVKAGERAAVAGPCRSKMIRTAGQAGVARLMMAAGPTLVARRDPCLCRGTPRFSSLSTSPFVRLGTAGFEAPRLRRLGLRTTKWPSGCTRPWGQPTETVPGALAHNSSSWEFHVGA